MPKRVRKEDIPSGREREPEKRMRARREEAAGGDVDAALRCFGAASAWPAREAAESDEGSHGKRRSSKYTSEATTMR
eukprot:842434-Pleurochrysis_carterae.AAC.1